MSTQVSLKYQLELALLWRTINVFLQSDDISFAVEFFKELLQVIHELPQLSLSNYWSDGGTMKSAISVLQDQDNLRNESSILPVPELAYLSSDSEDGFLLSGATKKHDILGVVQKLSETAESLALLQQSISCGRDLLEVSVALGVKSGRASLLLSAANAITEFIHNNHIDMCEMDAAILCDISNYIKNTLKGPVSDWIDILKECDIESDIPTLDEPNEPINHKLGVGTLLTFGKADHGKLGHGDSQVHRSVPTVVENIQSLNICKMASMSTYSVVLDSEGDVYVWGTGGASGSAQALRVDILPQPLESLMDKVVCDVSCGLGHALFLLVTGKVYSWGNGGNGRLGLGDTIDRADVCLVRDLDKEAIGSIHCGASHSMAITRRSGRVYTWGKNSQGQCGRGNLDDVLRPQLNFALKSEVIVKMAAGWEHTIALTSKGAVYSWGSGYKDSRRGLVPPVLGLGHSDSRLLPELLSTFVGVEVIDISSGWDHCLALDNKDNVYSWGSGQNGKLGNGVDENVASPKVIIGLQSLKVRQISCGCEHSAAILEDGTLYTWGHGDGGRLGHGDNEPRSMPAPVNTLRDMGVRVNLIHCGDKFTMVIADATTQCTPDSIIKKEKNIGRKEDELFSLEWISSHFAKSTSSKVTFEEDQNQTTHPSITKLFSVPSLSLKIDSPVQAKEEKKDSNEQRNVQNLISNKPQPIKELLFNMLFLMAMSNAGDSFNQEGSSLLNTMTNVVIQNDLINGDIAIQAAIKVQAATPFSTEISIFTFHFLLLLLTTYANDILESDDDFIMESSLDRDDKLLDIGILRSTILILTSNLQALEKFQSIKKTIEFANSNSKHLVHTVDEDLSFGGGLNDSIEENNTPANESFNTQVTPSEIQNKVSSVDERSRSSSDVDGEEDEGDDEEDENDNEDEEDDDEGDSDNDDYVEDARRHLHLLGSHDHEHADDEDDEDEEGLDEYEIEKLNYVDDDEEGVDAEFGRNREDMDMSSEDINLSADGTSDLRSLSEVMQRTGGVLSANDPEVDRTISLNNAGEEDFEFMSAIHSSNFSRDDEIVGISADGPLDVSSGMLLESFEHNEISKDSISNPLNRTVSPALSNESVEKDNLPGGKCEATAELEKDDNDLDSDQQGFMSGRDNPYGESDYDLDMQKALFFSMENQETEDEFVLTRKRLESSEAITILPQISEQLERLGDICYRNVRNSCGTSNRSQLMFQLWSDIQTAIGVGFSTLYTLEQQAGMLRSFLTNIERHLHISYGLKIALSSQLTLQTCLSTVFENKLYAVGPHKGYYLDESVIVGFVLDLNKAGITVHCVCEEFCTSNSNNSKLHDCVENCFNFIVNKSVISMLNQVVSYLLVKHMDNQMAKDDERSHPTVQHISHINSMISTIVHGINLDISDAFDVIPDSFLTYSEKNNISVEECFPSIKTILDNSFAGIMLRCLTKEVFSHIKENKSFKLTAEFVTYVKNLLRIYQKFTTNDGMIRSKSPEQGVSYKLIVQYMQLWMFENLKAACSVLSSTVHLLFSIVHEIHPIVNRMKYSVHSSYTLCANTLIDPSKIVSSEYHNIWKRMKLTHRDWNHLFPNFQIEINQRADSLLWTTLTSCLKSRCSSFKLKPLFEDSNSTNKLKEIEWYELLDQKLFQTATHMMSGNLHGALKISAEELAIAVAPFAVQLGNESIVNAEQMISAAVGLDASHSFSEWITLCRHLIFAILLRSHGMQNELGKFSDTKKESTFSKLSVDEGCKITGVWISAVTLTLTIVKSILFCGESLGELKNVSFNGFHVETRIVKVLCRGVDLLSTFIRPCGMICEPSELKPTWPFVSSVATVSVHGLPNRKLFEHIGVNFENIYNYIVQIFERGAEFSSDFSLINIDSMEHCSKRFSKLNSNDVSSNIMCLMNLGVALVGSVSIETLEDVAVCDYMRDLSSFCGPQLCSECISFLKGSERSLIYFLNDLNSIWNSEQSCGTLRIKNTSSINGNAEEFNHITISPNLSSYYAPEKNVIDSLLSLDTTICDAIELHFVQSVDSLGESTNSSKQKWKLISQLLKTFMRCLHFVKYDNQYFSSRVKFNAFEKGLNVIKSLLFETTGKRIVDNKSNISFGGNNSSDSFRALLSFSFLNDVNNSTNGNIQNCVFLCDDLKSSVSSNNVHNLFHMLEQCTNMFLSYFDNMYTILSNCVIKNTKLLHSYIRRIKYVSPVIIPNVFTPDGNYAIEFWMFVPSTLHILPSNKISNDKNARKVHILSRVTEAGELDLPKLFQDIKHVAVNPSIVLQFDDDGNAVLIVTVTSRVIVSKTGSKVSTASNKTVRVIKLSSESLQRNAWINVCVKYTTLESSNSQKASDRFHENGLLELMVNGKTQVSTTETFGRLSLHQNIVFGTIPDSLVETDPKSSLLVGDLRWSCSKQLSDRKTAPQSTDEVAKDIALTFSEPISLLCEKLLVASLSTGNLLISIEKSIFAILEKAEEVISTLDRASAGNEVASCVSALANIESIMDVIPKTASMAISLIGIAGTPLQEEAFRSLKMAVTAACKIRKISLTIKDYVNFQDIYKKFKSFVESFGKFFNLHLLHLTQIVEIFVYGRIDLATLVDESEKMKPLTIILKRVAFWRSMSFDDVVSASSFSAFCTNNIEENLFITQVACLYSYALNSALIPISSTISQNPTQDDSSSVSTSSHVNLILFICGGGWPVVLHAKSLVDLLPRALFLHRDLKGLEYSIFPARAIVHSAISHVGRPNSIWVSKCIGSYTRCAIPSSKSPDDETAIVPRSSHAILPATEMISIRDHQQFLTLKILKTVMSRYVVASPDVLIKYLTSMATNGPHVIRKIVDKISGSEIPVDENNWQGVGSDEALSLTLCMSHIRAIVVQLALAETFTGTEKLQQLESVLKLLQSNIKNLLGIASLDPVQSVIDAFNMTTTKGKGHMEILSSLLHEGDVTFLEKISLRLWRHFKTNREYASSGKEEETSNIPQIVVISGDVQIIGNKIRAQSHFPSVKILPVCIEKSTGRWFYECILLTDGLMQIGWADKSFRCDPICGQGVGDHLHSWALDGLRMKKWNVSCDSYGVRWKTEDVLGVLVDMDLLEMRFYINGQDMGSAFVGFTSNGLYPALSLNVRQCLRVNFGQAKFMYPPDEVDGLPYRPVLDALHQVKFETINTQKNAKDVGFKSDSANADFSGANSPKLTGDACDASATNSTSISRAVTFDGEDDTEGSSRFSSSVLNERRFSGALQPRSGETTISEAGQSGDNTAVALNPEIEARKQLLIESLIGMGFPVDWALRAAEHCDASVSESTAITWIIERMELEQAKLEELEGGDSRVANDEEVDETEDASGDQLRAAYTFGTAEIPVKDEKQESGRTKLLSKRLLATRNQDNHMRQTNLFDTSFQDQGVWNDEVQQYNTILPGHNCARRRFDSDKQAVICQIADLDFADLFSIVLSCQFALCIFYARFAFVRILRIFCSVKKTEWRTLDSKGNETFSALLSVVLDALVLHPDIMCTLLPLCFKQGHGAAVFPEKLFPSQLYGTSTGDPLDSLPPMEPFIRESTLRFSQILSKLEMSIYGTQSLDSDPSKFPLSIGSMAVEESSLQTIDTLKNLICALTELSDSIDTSSILRRSLAKTSRQILNVIMTKNVETFEIASAAVYDRRDWISGNMDRATDATQRKVVSTGNKPFVGWAYASCMWMIQTSNSLRYNVLNKSKEILQDKEIENPIEYLISDDTLNRIVKSAQSPNSSLNFCVYSLSSSILFRVNSKICRLEDVLHAASNVSLNLTSIADRDARERMALTVEEEESIDELASVASYGRSEIKKASKYLSGIVSTSFGLLSANSSGSRSSASAEYWLLRTLTTRLRTESVHCRIHSRYSRTIVSFLQQISALRKSIVGMNTFSAHIDNDVVEDVEILLRNQKSAPGKESIQSQLQVLQLSPNSITVSWNKVPTDDGSTENSTKHTSYSLHVTPLSGLQHLVNIDRATRMVLVLPFVSVSGTHRIDLLDSDTLYKITLAKDNGKQFVSPSQEILLDESNLGSNRSAEESSSDPSDSISVLASTLGEALFLLDSSPYCCPPQLVVSHQGLCVRNTLNKKWSTIRATARLCSGVHSWEIQIDRCVSKNIFIGVVSPEARIDNYVGCDKHGWAFLANRALWHNKAKVRAYGELFRTGDTVTVTLDLDLGTLSFSVNGKDMGIAVDKLKGPLYPAFSLYNEDDQLFLSPPRQVGVDAGDEERGTGWGTSGAERAIQRVETMTSLMQCISRSRIWQEKVEAKSQDRFQFIGNTQFLHELFLRWSLWCREIGMRSISHNGEFLTVVISSHLTLQMSDNRYMPGDIIQWENFQFVIVGVARHRLWLQKPDNGEFVGFTRETISQLHSRNALKIIRKSTWSSQIRGLNSTGPILLTDPRLSSLRVTPNEADTIEASGYNFPDIVNDENIVTSAMQKNCSEWTASQDRVLVEWLELRARVSGVHPLNLRLQDVISPNDFINKLEKNGDLFDMFSSKTNNRNIIRNFSEIQNKSVLELRMRAAFVIHLNDLISALLPVLYIQSSNQRSDDNTGAMQSCITAHVDIIFTEVKLGFGYRLSWRAMTTQIFPKSSSASDSALKLSEASSTVPSSRVVFSSSACELSILQQRSVRGKYSSMTRNSSFNFFGDLKENFDKSNGADPIQDEAVIGFVNTALVSTFTSMYDDSNGPEGGAKEGGISGLRFPTIQITPPSTLTKLILEENRRQQNNYQLQYQINVLQSDLRWKFMMAYESSLIGQLMAGIERQEHSHNSHTNAESNPTSSNGLSNTQKGRSDGPWENILHSICRGGFFWDDCLPPKYRPVSLEIKASHASQTYDSVDVKNLSDIKTIRVLQLCSILCDPAFSEKTGDPYGDSGSTRWSTLHTFLSAATEEIQSIFQHCKFWSNDEAHNVQKDRSVPSTSFFNLSTILEIILSFSDGNNLPDSIDVMDGLVWIMLQLMHGAGVVFGLAVRFGCQVDIMLPEVVWNVLSSERKFAVLEDNNFHEKTLDACCLAIRHGFTAIVPEDLLHLLTKSELKLLICGGFGTSFEMLRRNCDYLYPVNPMDTHILLFWTALGNVSNSVMFRFVNVIWETYQNGKNSTSEKVMLPEEYLYLRSFNSLISFALGDIDESYIWDESVIMHRTAGIFDKELDMTIYFDKMIEKVVVIVPKQILNISEMNESLRNCFELI